jgi:Ca2+-binding RTX toxin-like protein
LINIQNILTLAVIISLILPLQYNTLNFANGEMEKDSTLVVYNDNNSKNPVLADSKNTILKPKVEVSIEGTLNDDQLKGGEGDDKISGEDGYDTIAGRGGNDKINGGNGDDTINGELGNDTLKGENGDDKLSGEGGNDLIDGGKGDDKLLGGKGDDGILGDEGNDVLNGGGGVDIMAGGLGNDTFICDLFDTIIDFNLNEGDKIVGQCSSFDQTEIETSFDDNPPEDFQAGPTPPSFHPNNSPPEEFKLPPPQQQPKPQPPPPFSHDDIHSQDFGSVPPFPVPPSNEVYISGPNFN